MSRPSLLLLRRRRRRHQDLRRDETGLLDTLTNVVGVLVLITSLASVFVAAGSLSIQAPMARKSRQQFHLLQANGAGVWDLQPALERMLTSDRDRVRAVQSCMRLQGMVMQQCNANLDGWSKREQIGAASYSVNHSNGILQRVGAPTATASELKQSSGWLDATIARLARSKQPLFVILEDDGFDSYRAIKAKAQQYGVPIGWEPWIGNQAIHFWSNGGRSLTMQ